VIKLDLFLQFFKHNINKQKKSRLFLLKEEIAGNFSF